MPRPIPDNPELIDGWRYYLVALPDDDVAIAAGWDAFSALANYWEWGLEGPETDSDVMAQVWAAAMYETMRIRDMGFPDSILDYIDEVESLLRAIADNACCNSLPGADTVIGETEADLPDSDTDVSSETWPPGITSESEWNDYICNAATAYVDRLIATPARITTVTSYTVGALTALVLWFTGGAYIALAGIALFTIAQLFEVLAVLEELIDAINAGTEDTETEVESELNAAREDLICAIVQANDYEAAGSALRSALADALTSTAWTNILFLLTSNSAMAAIFEAQAGDAPDATCNCDITPGTITGYACTVDYFTINGSSTGGNTNCNVQEQSEDSAEYLHPTGSQIVLGNQAMLASGERTNAHGSLNARSNIVADNEESFTPQSGLDAVARLKIFFFNGSSGLDDDLFETQVSEWQLFDDDTDTWRPATVAIVSSDDGWTLDGNSLKFADDDIPHGTGRTCIIDLEYSN